MKILSYTVFILCILFCNCTNNTLQPIKLYHKNEYKGKVKKVVETMNTLVEITYFDTTGKDTALYSYHQDGSLFYKKANKYNENSILIETISYFSNIHRFEKIAYSYSADFRVKKAEKVDCESNCFTKMFVCDSFGNETHEYSINDNKKIILVQNFFDAKHNKIKVYNYKNGVHSSTIDYKYNSIGDPVFQYSNYFDLNRVVIRKINYVYDENKNWIEKVELNEYNDVQNIYKRKIEYFDKTELDI